MPSSAQVLAALYDYSAAAPVVAAATSDDSTVVSSPDGGVSLEAGSSTDSSSQSTEGGTTAAAVNVLPVQGTLIVSQVAGINRQGICGDGICQVNERPAPQNTAACSQVCPLQVNMIMWEGATCCL
jgi:hypothetical protein